MMAHAEVISSSTAHESVSSTQVVAGISAAARVVVAATVVCSATDTTSSLRCGSCPLIAVASAGLSQFWFSCRWGRASGGVRTSLGAVSGCSSKARLILCCREQSVTRGRLCSARSKGQTQQRPQARPEA